MNDNAVRLGTEPVHKLLFSFALPAITGMIVNTLYNVIDRIYVGNGVGEAALGGLALCASFMTIIFSFAMLFGIGTANLISIKLGEKKIHDAKNAITHCFFLLMITGVILTVIGLAFLKPILILFGAREGSVSFGYAVEYMQVILYGNVFNLLAFGFSHCTRAQGFPKITMVSMLIGAITNIILDPIFIFTFGWGVKGAAIATVISQFVSMVFILRFIFFSKKVIVRPALKEFEFSIRIIISIISFGSAQFLLNVAAAAVTAILNKSLITYGIIYFNSESGGDTALAGVNIVNSVAMFVLMPVFGINQGAQPILGYNYGAKKYKRVMQAYKYAVFAATCITTAGFILAQVFPSHIVKIFASQSSSDLLEFGTKTIRAVLVLLPLIGFQIVSSNYFIVTGKPKMSIILSLSRQVLILIPCILIFGHFFQLNGLIWAMPVSDLVSVVLTGIFIFFELKKLRHLIADKDASKAEARIESEKIETVEM